MLPSHYKIVGFPPLTCSPLTLTLILDKLRTPNCDRLFGLVVRVPGYRFRGPGFDSRCYQIFWELLSLERGTLRFLSTIEELFGRNSSSKAENTAVGISCDDHETPLYLQKLALTSTTSGCRSVCIVCSQTKATEFSYFSFFTHKIV
jgi:hypothetical protein